jgi:hypothetical protein
VEVDQGSTIAMSKVVSCASPTGGSGQSRSVGRCPGPAGVDRSLSESTDDENHAGDEYQQDHDQRQRLATVTSPRG